MYKKWLIVLSGFILLAACDEGKTPDSNSKEKEPVVEETNGNTEIAEINKLSHTYNNLVNEATFTEEYGLQAWKDYKIIIEDVTLGEINLINVEEPNYEELNGTTSGEIQEQIDSIGVREDVFRDEVEVSEKEKMIFYRYPPATDSEYKEMAAFLAELTFYYADDYLMFSSITPGFYSVEMDDLLATNDLMTFTKVSDIEEVKPKIYTIAQMQINNEKIEQVMIPAMAINEEGSEELMAFYFFTKGENIIQYAYLPFEMVSQDFPTHSVLLYYQLIPELENQ